jgi:hypothetical protein
LSFEFWTKFEFFVLSCFNGLWGSFQLFRNLLSFLCLGASSVGVGRRFELLTKFELFVLSLAPVTLAVSCDRNSATEILQLVSRDGQGRSHSRFRHNSLLLLFCFG